MAEITELIKEAEADIDREIQIIFQEAEKKVDTSKKEEEKQTASEILKIKQQFEKEKEKIIKRHDLEIEFEKKKQLLKTKNRLVDAVIEKIREKVLDLNREDYIRFFGKYLKKLIPTLSMNEIKIGLGRKEKYLNNAFFTENLPGFRLDFTGKTKDQEYGFLIETADYRISCSADYILNEYRENNLKTILDEIYK